MVIIKAKWFVTTTDNIMNTLGSLNTVVLSNQVYCVIQNICVKFYSCDELPKSLDEVK